MKLNKFLISIFLLLVYSCISFADPPKQELPKVSGPQQTMEMCVEQHGTDYKQVAICYRTQEKAAKVYFEQYLIPLLGKYENKDTGEISKEATKDKKVQIIYNCSESWKDSKGHRDWIMTLMCVEKALDIYEEYLDNHTI